MNRRLEIAKGDGGGKVVPKNASLSNATAHVAVQIPARAKGKTLVVKVTITANGKTATRTIPYVIG